MDRIHSNQHREVIGVALALIPARFRPLLDRARFWGADPLFTGLHRYQDASYGRSFSRTAHVVFPHHLLDRPVSDRRTTVVLPQPVSPFTVVHELGHVLDEALGWPEVQPIDWYSEANRNERLASAFTSYVLGPADDYHGTPQAHDRLRRDRAGWALLGSLGH